MLRIKAIHIKRYRSIMDMKLEIDEGNNFITICGENNTGKTNTLRAIDLFFHPGKFMPQADAPHHKYEGTRGAAVYPEIKVDFIDDKYQYSIKKIFDIEGVEKVEGRKKSLKRRVKWRNITKKTISNLLEKEIAVFYIESININFPDLINNLIDDLYDIEFARSRFTGLKRDLKEFFEKYIEGLLGILNDLAKDINPKFENYHSNWGIGFDFENDLKKFRDIITNDVVFYIDDKSNKRIDAKGSGLQRLAFLLMNFRIIEKIKKKSVILLIDEPDIFLHHGIQKKLYDELVELSNKNQVLITTHSPVYIDSYRLKNVFLLELEISSQHYQRRQKEYNILRTKTVELNQLGGAKKIREYLGIPEKDYDVLDSYNLIVEGDSDKKYIEELLKYFNLVVPNIISADGADNIPNDLDWYNSFYRDKEESPKVLVLLDNDQKGRDVYRKISSKLKKNKLGNISIRPIICPNSLGENPDTSKLDEINTTQEIEDFVYPELICLLANRILMHRGLSSIDKIKICQSIKMPAHKDNGILFYLEMEKNNANPQDGDKIKVKSSSFKRSLASMLQIETDNEIISLLENHSSNYPKVYEFLVSITQPFQI